MCELESIFRALAARKRRDVLACVQLHHSVSLADLAEFSIEQERNRDVSDIPADDIRNEYLILYHDHIPKLENADLVQYEQETDTVYRTGATLPSLQSARASIEHLIDVAN